MQRCSCRLLQWLGWMLFFGLSLNSATAALLESGCDLKNQLACTELQYSQGSSGVCASLSTCRPPPYYPDLCDTVHNLALPTLAVYAAPESVYSGGLDSGFAANQVVLGNYQLVALEPEKILLQEYDVQVAAPLTPLNGTSATKSYGSFGDQQWIRNAIRGRLNVLPDLPRSLPQLSRAEVDNRLFATSWSYFYRALEDRGLNPSVVKVSFSPFAKKCFPVSKDGHLTLQEYLSPGQSTASTGLYQNFGAYLNRFDRGVYDRFGSTASSHGFFNKCSETPIVFERRPAYFVWQRFSGCVFKNQLDRPLK